MGNFKAITSIFILVWLRALLLRDKKRQAVYHVLSAYNLNEQ